MVLRTIPFRMAYLQAVADGIEVDDGLVRVIGGKSALEQTIAGSSAVSAESGWSAGC